MNTTCKYLAAIIALCAFLGAQGQNTSPIPGNFAGKVFVLPIMRGGKKEMLVRGKQAKSDGNLISLSGTRISMYLTDKQGGQTTISSAKCTYDMVKQFGHSSEAVNIRSKQLVIDGVGYDLDGVKQVITIRSRVKVRVFNRENSQLIGVKASDATKAPPKKDKKKPKSGYTTITADTMVYDLKNGTVIFCSTAVNTVRAIEFEDKDKEVFRMDANSMTLYRDKEGQFTRIDAIKDVVCTTPPTAKIPGGRATARRAHYDKLKSMMVFSGDPVLVQGGDTLEGAEQLIYVKKGEARLFYTEGGLPKYRIASNPQRRKGIKDVLQPDKAAPKNAPAPKPPQP